MRGKEGAQGQCRRRAEGQRAAQAPQGARSLLTYGLSCVDVDDEARGLVPAQDLVLSWKGNTKVMARAGAGKDERDKGSCG